MTRRRILLFLLLLGLGGFFAYRMEALRAFDPAALRAWLLGLGPRGPILFIGCFALGHLLQVPSSLFLAVAVLTWSRPLAFFTLWIGTVTAGLPSFLLARYLARAWVQKHIPQRFRRYDSYIAEHGFRAVVVLRLVFFTVPYFPPALATSRARLRHFIGGSIIGLLPGIALWVVLGPRLIGGALHLSPATWTAIGVLAAGFAATGYLYRRHRLARILAAQPNESSA